MSQPEHTPDRPESDPVPELRRLYGPPTIERLGTLRELTLGQGGSNHDAGHLTPTKRGQG